MITYPCCKINLGLNVVAKRKDGYHDLETVFYPVNLTDCLEVNITEGGQNTCLLTISGNKIDGNADDNLIVKAYKLLNYDFDLPHINFNLEKHIPSQAGLGGGSADATFTLRGINKLCNLSLTTNQLQQYAARLGADCAFFATAEPAYATGIGEILQPLGNDLAHLKGLHLFIVKPPVAISTAQAFSFITPKTPTENCLDIVKQPVTEWHNHLANDFEHAMFSLYPEIKNVKQALYDMGAYYAQMSGSGSAFFAILPEKPTLLPEIFKNWVTFGSTL